MPTSEQRLAIAMERVADALEAHLAFVRGDTTPAEPQPPSESEPLVPVKVGVGEHEIMVPKEVQAQLINAGLMEKP